MKTVLISSFLMGVAVTASAQTLTFGTEPSYPPFELTTEKWELVGLILISPMPSAKKFK